jgi:microsomal epoxide hydrolase
LFFIHGWPGSYLEFLGILDILRTKYTPETLPYHVIVPSLPGFPFSPLPVLERDFEAEDVARIFDALALGLFGEKEYVVQGGDIGSRIGRILGAKYPRCKGTNELLSDFSKGNIPNCSVY